MAAASLAGLPVMADDKPAADKLPRRRYGRTGLEIGWLLGASDWTKELIPRAVDAGVNYWHKAQRWTAETLPPALKKLPRESYHLECVVDRVGGDHNRGRIDEGQHYQFVKDRLKESGVGYYDVFKFHFGYHSVKEAKENPGMVRAFERLKKEGLVKHLAISQHHYNNINGDMAWDVLDYLAEHQPYDATQFFYTYGDRKEVQDWIDVAKKKDIATVAMKTMGGVGRAARDEKFRKLLVDPKYQGSTAAAAMVKWLKSNEDLTAAVIATKNIAQFRENVGAAAGLAMAPQDQATLALLSGYNKGLTCLLCAQCVSSCPEHIAVADIFRYERYGRDYLDLDRARREYAALTRDGTSCVGCGDCLAACVREIDIPAKLREVHRLLG
ncbi:MAG: aldo/keto reductase [Planctomycetia bacterium]|nr:aldo/keto reductase [Planctomycetia bacterium]